MKKGNMKMLISVALIAILCLSWYTMLDDASTQQDQYDGYLTIAREKRENTLYDDALEQYALALEMNNSMELREEIADFYKQIKRWDSYLRFCEDTISQFPYDERAYIRMVEYYNSVEDYKQCFTYLDKASKRQIVSAQLQEMKASLLYVFEYKHYGFEQVRVFAKNVCAVQKSNGKWGYTNLKGETYLGFNYLSASEFIGDYVAVQLESGEYALIDGSGREKSKDPEKKAIEDCTFFFDGKMAVKYNGKYHYCDTEFKELFGAYDFAGTFNFGYAAVMNDGVWYFIDPQGNQVGETFEDIKVDEKGVAFRNGVAFVKKNGKYILVDTAGNAVCNDSWVDVDCFNSDQPAAVYNGEAWGFVNTAGQLVVDYTYESAKSFANGFAAVAQQGKWGYIILEDYTLKIEYQFVDAADFSKGGTAYVKSQNGWDLIRLYSYNQ